MTELEQLQLQNKCEQLEILTAQLSYLHVMTLSMYHAHKSHIRECFEKIVGSNVVSFNQLEKLSHENLKEIIIDWGCSSQTFESILRIVDSYLANINKPYEEIAFKIVKQRANADTSDDFKYARQIAGIKEEE